MDKYAEVAVKVGLNLQPDQRLSIGAPVHEGLTPIEAAPLVRLIAAWAYRVGVRPVDMMWRDDQLKPVRLRYSPRDSFDEYPMWQVNTTLEYLQRGDALLVIDAHNPDLHRGQDPKLLGIIEQVGSKNTAPIFDCISRSLANWLVIAAPVSGWASKVFPGDAPDVQDARLWDTL